MEEKKFPWLLRLLSTNSSCVHMLETYVLHKEKIISNFINETNYILSHRTSKNTSFSLLSPLLEYLYSQSTGASTCPIKHIFFIYKSNRKEISQSLLKSYITKKKSAPPTSYIQITRSSLKSMIKWEVEYTKTGYKSSISPSSTPISFLEQAKEISKEIISLVELHENKKILKLTLDFFIDSNFKLVLSYLPLCILSSRDHFFKASSNSHPSICVKTNELNDIVNELSSPSRVLKRQPSLIRVIDRKNSFMEKIEIDSPLMHANNNSSMSRSSHSDIEPEAAGKIDNSSEKTKYDKNFLEILCKMRIINKTGFKKHFYTDKEIEDEKETIEDIVSKATKRESEKFKHKNSIEFRKFDANKFKQAKSKALNLIQVGINNKRSGSIEELSLPILSSRSNKNKSTIKKSWM